MYVAHDEVGLGSLLSSAFKKFSGQKLSSVVNAGTITSAASLIPGAGALLGPLSSFIPGIAGALVSPGSAAAPTSSPINGPRQAFAQPDGSVVQLVIPPQGSAEERAVKTLNEQYTALTQQAQAVFAQAQQLGIALPQELNAWNDLHQVTPTTLLQQAQQRNARMQYRINWTVQRLGVRAAQSQRTAAVAAGGSAGVALAVGAAALLILTRKRRK